MLGHASEERVAARVAREVCGFTLLEIVVATAIVGTLAAITLPQYHSHIERAKMVRAAKEIRTLEIDISTYLAGAGTLPLSLVAIGRSDLKDPWGNQYQYLITATAKTGAVRKDRFLVPINSDYDLYSKGPDGKSQAPLSSAAGRDDIVRANDGSYVGPASQY